MRHLLQCGQGMGMNSWPHVTVQLYVLVVAAGELPVINLSLARAHVNISTLAVTSVLTRLLSPH
jgi:hypothetical protein